MSPQVALGWSEEWDDVDVVVVDAHDAEAGWDRFIGISVTLAVRSRRTRDQTAIVMITGHAHNDRLRLRAADAGADFLFAHTDVRSPEDLVAAIRSPTARLHPSPAGRDLTRALELAGRDEIRQLFEPGVVQKQVTVSRRGVISLRSRLGRLLGLGPSPTLREAVRHVNDARGVATPPDK